MVLRDSAKLVLFASLAIVTKGLGFAQSVAPRPVEIRLTGVVLTTDLGCDEKHDQDEASCGRSDWALASGRTIYLLFGDKSKLQRFEHKRVIVEGSLEQEPIARDGWQVIRRKIAVRSIENSDLSEQAVEGMVQWLKVFPWQGQPAEECNNGCWGDFAFTDAMVVILQAGRGAQSTLLRHLNDQSIEDQIVMLLGGIGDENAIPPIIERLTDGNNESLDARSKRLNLVGNVALMNVTLADVVGPWSRCPSTPKTCWSKWWLDHKGSFKEDAITFRRISSYPGYGIYEQFNDASLN